MSESCGAWTAGVYKHVCFLTRSKRQHNKKTLAGYEAEISIHGLHQKIDEQCGFHKLVEQKL